MEYFKEMFLGIQTDTDRRFFCFGMKMMDEFQTWSPPLSQRIQPLEPPLASQLVEHIWIDRMEEMCELVQFWRSKQKQRNKNKNTSADRPSFSWIYFDLKAVAGPAICRAFDEGAACDWGPRSGLWSFCEAVHDSGSDNPEVLVFKTSVLKWVFYAHIFGDVQVSWINSSDVRWAYPQLAVTKTISWLTCRYSLLTGWWNITSRPWIVPIACWSQWSLKTSWRSSLAVCLLSMSFKNSTVVARFWGIVLVEMSRAFLTSLGSVNQMLDFQAWSLPASRWLNRFRGNMFNLRVLKVLKSWLLFLVFEMAFPTPVRHTEAFPKNLACTFAFCLPLNSCMLRPEAKNSLPPQKTR